jgi:hypothetical protein
MAKHPTKFIASIEEKEIANIQDIARALEGKGCKITNILSFTGVICGETERDESSLQDLKIKGIKHIEEDGEVKAFGG